MQVQSRTGERRTRRTAGFALIDVMIAGVVLTIAVVGTSGAMLSGLALQRTESESSIARQAARRAIEELQGVPFEEVFRAYNATVGDNAGLTVAARGPSFAVAGLTPDPADVDGQCGRVMLPIVNAGAVETLSEAFVDADLGMPGDLNGDGVQDALDHSGDYVVLPVRVRVEWRGIAGPMRYDLATILSER
jgi:type II secretory pathway pseudopilin PulG